MIPHLIQARHEMSELPKFTAGPWSVPHFAEPDVNCNCRYVLCDHMMGAVASVHCSGPGEDWQAHGDNPRFAEAVANAHLIAAAPDLYAALERLQAALVHPNNRDIPYWQSARDALAKARGEQ